MLEYMNPEGYADPTPYHALTDKGVTNLLYQYRHKIWICKAADIRYNK